MGSFVLHRHSQQRHTNTFIVTRRACRWLRRREGHTIGSTLTGGCVCADGDTAPDEPRGVERERRVTSVAEKTRAAATASGTVWSSERVQHVNRIKGLFRSKALTDYNPLRPRRWRGWTNAHRPKARDYPPRAKIRDQAGNGRRLEHRGLR